MKLILNILNDFIFLSYNLHKHHLPEDKRNHGLPHLHQHQHELLRWTQQLQQQGGQDARNFELERRKRYQIKIGKSSVHYNGCVAFIQMDKLF
jgi:hypothetical protein